MMVTIHPNPWTVEIQTWTTATVPRPLTRWQIILEYLKALYR